LDNGRRIVVESRRLSQGKGDSSMGRDEIHEMLGGERRRRKWHGKRKKDRGRAMPVYILAPRARLGPVNSRV
jgi:hypothetical protein